MADPTRRLDRALAQLESSARAEARVLARESGSSPADKKRNLLVGSAPIRHSLPATSTVVSRLGLSPRPCPKADQTLGDAATSTKATALFNCDDLRGLPTGPVQRIRVPYPPEGRPNPARVMRVTHAQASELEADGSDTVEMDVSDVSDTASETAAPDTTQPIGRYKPPRKGSLPLDAFDPSGPGDEFAAVGQSALSRFINTAGRTVWRRCIVTGYDAVDGRYQIRWSDGDLPLVRPGAPVEKSVGRFNLRLPGEEPGGELESEWYRRRRVATASRNAVEARVRLDAAAKEEAAAAMEAQPSDSGSAASTGPALGGGKHFALSRERLLARTAQYTTQASYMACFDAQLLIIEEMYARVNLELAAVATAANTKQPIIIDDADKPTAHNMCAGQQGSRALVSQQESAWRTRTAEERAAEIVEIRRLVQERRSRLVHASPIARAFAAKQRLHALSSAIHDLCEARSTTRVSVVLPSEPLSLSQFNDGSAAAMEQATATLTKILPYELSDRLSQGLSQELLWAASQLDSVWEAQVRTRYSLSTPSRQSEQPTFVGCEAGVRPAALNLPPDDASASEEVNPICGARVIDAGASLDALESPSPFLEEAADSDEAAEAQTSRSVGPALNASAASSIARYSNNVAVCPANERKLALCSPWGGSQASEGASWSEYSESTNASEACTAPPERASSFGADLLTPRIDRRGNSLLGVRSSFPPSASSRGSVAMRATTTVTSSSGLLPAALSMADEQPPPSESSPDTPALRAINRGSIIDVAGVASARTAAVELAKKMPVPVATTLRMTMLAALRLHGAIWQAAKSGLIELVSNLFASRLGQVQRPPAFSLTLVLAKPPAHRVKVECDPSPDLFASAVEGHVGAIDALATQPPRIDFLTDVAGNEHFQRPLGDAASMRYPWSERCTALRLCMLNDCASVSKLVAQLNLLPALAELSDEAFLDVSSDVSSAVLAALARQTLVERRKASEALDILSLLTPTTLGQEATVHGLRIHVGVFALDCADLIAQVRAMREARAAALLSQLKTYVLRRCSEVQATADRLSKQLSCMPGTPEELYELKQIVMEQDAATLNAQATAQKLSLLFDELEQLQCTLSDDEARARWELKCVPSRMARRVERAKHLFKQLQTELKTQLLRDVELFGQRVANAAEKAVAVHAFDDLASAVAHSRSASDAAAELAQCTLVGVKLNAQEEIFGSPRSDWPEIEVAATVLQPHVELWQLAADWLNWSADWNDGEFVRLVPQQIRDSLSGARSRARSLRERLHESPVVITLLTEIEKQMSAFQCHLPLMTALLCPGMRERHWEEFDAVTGISFRPTLDMTLTKILASYDLQPHLEAIEAIAVVASREATVEHALDRMQSEMSHQLLPLEVTEQEDGSEWVELGEIGTLLDGVREQVASAHQLKGSADAAVFANRAEAYEKRLLQTEEACMRWSQCQKLYGQLQPIASMSEVKRMASFPSHRFEQAETVWRSQLKRALAKPRVLSLMSDEKLIPALVECLRAFESISRDLHSFLDAKRSHFARLYAVSDLQLLQMLADAVRPNAQVQLPPHLPAVFPALSSVRLCFSGRPPSPNANSAVAFDAMQASGDTAAWPGEKADRLDRSAMNGATSKLTKVSFIHEARPVEEPCKFVGYDALLGRSGEVVPLLEGGLIDKPTDLISWLKDVQVATTATLRALLPSALDWASKTWEHGCGMQHKAVEASPNLPAQLADLSSLVVWTAAVETAINQHNPREPLEQIKERCTQHFAQTALHIRKFSSHLERHRAELQRATLCAVRERDATAELLAGVSGLSAEQPIGSGHWLWLRQQRAYMLGGSSQIGAVEMRQGLGALPYGFEYLGMAPRLILTAGSGRHLLALIGAIADGCAACLRGFASGRHAEIVTDLGRAAGQWMLEVHCTHATAPDGLARSLVAAAVGGGWCVLLRMASLAPRVLQALGQTLLEVRAAVTSSAGSARVSNLEVKLTPSHGPPCSCFAAIGLIDIPPHVRHEVLPKTLSLQMRPCGLVLPDALKATEAALASGGFENAVQLAHRAVAFDRLVGHRDAAGHARPPLSPLGTTCGSSERALLLVARCAAVRLKAELEQRTMRRQLKKATRRPAPGLGGALSRATAKARDMEDEHRPTLDEEIPLVRAAIRQVYGPAFAGSMDTVERALRDTLTVGGCTVADDEAPDEQGLTCAQVREAVIRAADDAKLAPSRALVAATEALHVALASRRAVLLLGQVGTGKTSAYRVLRLASQYFGRDNKAELAAEHAKRSEPLVENLVKKWKAAAAAEPTLEEAPRSMEGVTVISPSALPRGGTEGLLGWFEASGQWHDGVLTTLLRTAIDASVSGRGSIVTQRPWLIFDGPLHSHWMQGLLGILEFDTSLQLPSHERLELPRSARVILEAASVEHACPATLAHCCVVPVPGGGTHWEEVLDRWVTAQGAGPQLVDADGERRLRIVLVALISAALRAAAVAAPFSAEETDQGPLVTAAPLSLVLHALELMHTMLTRRHQLMKARAASRVTSKASKRVSFLRTARAVVDNIKSKFDPPSNADLDAMMLLAVQWSIGTRVAAGSISAWTETVLSALQGESLSSLLESHGLEHVNPPPERSQLHLLWYDFEDGMGWHPAARHLNHSDSFQPDGASMRPLGGVYLPSPQLAGVALAMSMILNETCCSPTLLDGPAGSGKSAALSYIFAHHLPDDFKHIRLSLQPNSSAESLHDMLRSRMQVDRSRQLVPPSGRCVVFVDDIHLPAHAADDSQPPLELLRQLVEHGSWQTDDSATPYTISPKFRFVAALTSGGCVEGPPSSRLLRHFHSFRLHPLVGETVAAVFSAMLKVTVGEEAVDAAPGQKLIDATAGLWDLLHKLAPNNATRPHALWSVNDLVSVALGCGYAGARPMVSITGAAHVFWNECAAVFGQRGTDLAALVHRAMSSMLSREWDLSPGYVHYAEDGSLDSEGDVSEEDSTITARQDHTCDATDGATAVGQEGSGPATTDASNVVTANVLEPPPASVLDTSNDVAQAAAVKVQSVARGKAARNAAKDKQAAAVKVQSVARGRAARQTCQARGAVSGSGADCAPDAAPAVVGRSGITDANAIAPGASARSGDPGVQQTSEHDDSSVAGEAKTTAPRASAARQLLLRAPSIGRVRVDRHRRLSGHGVERASPVAEGCDHNDGDENDEDEANEPPLPFVDFVRSKRGAKRRHRNHGPKAHTAYLPADSELDVVQQLREIMEKQPLTDHGVSRRTSITTASGDSPLGFLQIVPAVMRHVAAIVRSTRLPGRGLLLLGPPSCGKQSLARLAAAAANVRLVHVSVHQLSSSGREAPLWRRDFSAALRSAGVEGKHTVLLVPDAVACCHHVLTDLQELLAIGAHRYLWNAEELGQISKATLVSAKKAGRGETTAEVVDFFWERALFHFHPLLCIDPTKSARTQPHAFDAGTPSRDVNNCFSIRDRPSKERGVAGGVEGILGSDDWSWLRGAINLCPAVLSSCTPHWVGEWDVRSREHYARAQLPGNMPMDQVEALSEAADGMHVAAVSLGRQAVAAGEISVLQAPSQAAFFRMLTEYRRVVSEQRAALSVATQRVSAALERLLQAEQSTASLETEIFGYEQDLATCELSLQVHEATLATHASHGDEADPEELQAVLTERKQREQLLAAHEKASNRQRLAQLLLHELNRHKGRWGAELCALQTRFSNLNGDALLCAGFFAYGAPLPDPLRQSMLAQWKTALTACALSYTSDLSLQSVLASPDDLRRWVSLGLADESTAVQNAAMYFTGAARPVLLLDPHRQMTAWLRTALPSLHEKPTAAAIREVHPGEQVERDTLDTFAAEGTVLLLTRVEELQLSGGPLPQPWADFLQFPDRHPSWHAHFRFVMSCGASMPVLPAWQLKYVQVIDCTVADAAIEHSLLMHLLNAQRHRPQMQLGAALQEQRELRRELVAAEEALLSMLAQMTPEFMTDTQAQNSLSTCAAAAAKQDNACHDIESSIEAMTDVHAPWRTLARGCAAMFATCSRLRELDDSLYYSLEWYVKQLDAVNLTMLHWKAAAHTAKCRPGSSATATAIDHWAAEAYVADREKLLRVHDDGTQQDPLRAEWERVIAFSEALGMQLFSEICPALWPQQQRALAIAISMKMQEIATEKLRCFESAASAREQLELLRQNHELLLREPSLPERIAGGSAYSPKMVAQMSSRLNVGSVQHECPGWLATPCWEHLRLLESTVRIFDGLSAALTASDTGEAFREWHQATRRAEGITERLPGKWRRYLPGTLSFALLLRYLCPDRHGEALDAWAQKHVGSFTWQPASVVLAIAADKTPPASPLLLRVGPGASPLPALRNLATQKHVKLVEMTMEDSRKCIDSVEELIEEAVDLGWWVLLHGVDLAPEVLDRLTTVATSISEARVHSQFHLWATCEAAACLPDALLSHVKRIAFTRPRCLADQVDAAAQYQAEQPGKCADASMALAMMHAVVSARQEVGGCGHSSRRDVSEVDLAVGLRQLVPHDRPDGSVVAGLVVEALQGASLHEECDAKLLRSVVNSVSCLLQPATDYQTRTGHGLRIDGGATRAALTRQLGPLAGVPQASTMHASALATRELLQLSATLSRTLPANVARRSPMTLSESTMRVVSLLEQIAGGLPRAMQRIQPNAAMQSSAGWLAAELLRYEKLRSRVESDVERLLRLLRGPGVQCTHDRTFCDSVAADAVPAEWLRLSFPSCPRALEPWTAGLVQRLEHMYEHESTGGRSGGVWMDALYSPSVFLDEICHEHARALSLPVTAWSEIELLLSTESSQQEGYMVTGLFVEGASWDDETGTFRPAEGEWLVRLPPVHVQPRHVPTSGVRVSGHQKAFTETSAQFDTASDSLDAALGNDADELSLPEGATAVRLPVFRTRDRTGAPSTDGRYHSNAVGTLSAAFAAVLSQEGQKASIDGVAILLSA